MTPYTPIQINTLLYSIDDIDGMLVLAEYLKWYGHFYPHFINTWIEDIRLFLDVMR